MEVHSEKLGVIKTVVCVFDHELEPGMDIVHHLYKVFQMDGICFVQSSAIFLFLPLSFVCLLDLLVTHKVLDGF